jgi:hypothetical protein
MAGAIAPAYLTDPMASPYAEVREWQQSKPMLSDLPLIFRP